jgi:ABC-2 type transport system permease protein
MQTTLKPQSLFNQLIDLTLIQLSNWRWSWRSMVIVGTLAPVISTAALGLFARASGERTLGYILTGNLVLALMFGTLDKVASNFAFMRFRGMLGYFATLPIHGYSLVAATVVAFFLLSLPTMAVTLVFGVLYLGLNTSISPALLVVLPLAALPLAGVGALIGARARSPEEAGSLSLLLSILLVGFGPVIVPPERLPPVLVLFGFLNPATYAASALRQALLGPLTPRILLDLALLLVLALAVLWLVGRVMDWRRVGA